MAGSWRWRGWTLATGTVFGAEKPHPAPRVGLHGMSWAGWRGERGAGAPQPALRPPGDRGHAGENWGPTGRGGTSGGVLSPWPLWPCPRARADPSPCPAPWGGELGPQLVPLAPGRSTLWPRGSPREWDPPHPPAHPAKDFRAFPYASVSLLSHHALRWQPTSPAAHTCPPGPAGTVPPRPGALKRHSGSRCGARGGRVRGPPRPPPNPETQAAGARTRSRAGARPSPVCIRRW